MRKGNQMKYIALLIFALFGSQAKAEYSFTMQTGAYNGVIGLGIGKHFESYKTEILLGHVPQFMDVRDLWNLSWKNHVSSRPRIIDYSSISFYGGINTIAALGNKKTYIFLPDQYPDGYYPPTGLRVAPYAGFETRRGNFSTFFEVTSLDLYLETYVRSNFNMDISEVVTYGFGVRYFPAE